jgi:nucleoid-associated protein YgaU
MRATMFVMLALTLLLGLALGWFSKGAGPVASHASNGEPVATRGLAEETREGVVAAPELSPADPAVAATAPAASELAAQAALDAAELAASTREPAAEVAVCDSPAEDASEVALGSGEGTAEVEDQPDEQLAALPRTTAPPEPTARRDPQRAASSVPPPPVPQPLSPGEPPSFAGEGTFDPPPFDPETGELYVVREGDSLSTIALRRYGELKAYRRIYEENRDRIVDPKKIYPGQTLILPKAP